MRHLYLLIVTTLYLLQSNLNNHPQNFATCFSIFNDDNNNNSPDAAAENQQRILALEESQDYNFAAIRNAHNKQPREEIYVFEDKDYPKLRIEQYPAVGQVSGIASLPSGDVAIFHRQDRVWTDKTFDKNFTIAAGGGGANLIKNDTIMIIDRDNGQALTTFGSQLFYMPHSIAADSRGNLWVSDVARHQVMRLPTSMLELDRTSNDGSKRWLPGNLSRLWPDIIIGEAFVPGQDRAHFCQPSELVISSDDRLLFVADGYCNQRIMVFTTTGQFLTSFGEDLGFKVVHSLTLIEERNLICAADRENARILCFQAGLDGNLDSIGQLALSLDYPLGRVFAIEAISSNHLLVSSNQFDENGKYDLAILNPFTNELKPIWSSSDLLIPHSLARTKDGLHVYAADLSKDSYKKLFKFFIIGRTMMS